MEKPKLGFLIDANQISKNRAYLRDEAKVEEELNRVDSRLKGGSAQHIEDFIRIEENYQTEKPKDNILSEILRSKHNHISKSSSTKNVEEHQGEQK